MFGRLFARFTRQAPPPPPNAPADPIFWALLGHSATRAFEIAECFPEYWKDLRDPHPNAKAKYCLSRQLGDIPLHCRDPATPKYVWPHDLPETDPIMWCRVQNHDLYTLAEAVDIAVRARRCPNDPALDPFRAKWHEMRGRLYNDKRKRFYYSDQRTPAEPTFWRQLGHNPHHARRLIRCCPEYWFRKTKCSWKMAVRLAARTLKRLAQRFEAEKSRFHELAETSQYDIAKRDPIYWHLRGLTFDQALRRITKRLFYTTPKGCQEYFQHHRSIRKAGRRAELLHDGSIHVSGPALGYQKEYERLQTRRAASPGSANPHAWPRWGPLALDDECAAKAHCCAVGPASLGTDTLLNILMTSTANDRWLVFDGRGDLLPAIKAIRPDDQLQLFNPLDLRTSAWNIAEDATSTQHVQDIVAAFLPSDPHFDPLLLASARAVLSEVIHALNIKAPGKWDLSHLIAALDTQNLASVLSADAATLPAYKTLAANPHAIEVTSFLQTLLDPLKPTAAAWRHASRSMSISAWRQSASALLLTNTFRSQHLLAPLNRILFHLTTSSLLQVEGHSAGRTWVFLSDLCQIGRLESLATLLTQSPSAGLTVALTLEDVELLQRHYGAEATGILGLCGNFAFLHMTNPATARWATQVIGVEKVHIIHQTKGTLDGKTSTGVTIMPAERPLVPPSAFQQLPLPDNRRGLVGYFRNLAHRAYKGEINLEQSVKNGWLHDSTTDEPALVPCPDENLQFPQETTAILAELGFSHLPAKPKSTRPKSKSPKPAHPALTDDPPTTGQVAQDFDPDDFPRIEVTPE